MPKVTIIGAGIAGMTAALRLAERGYQVTIFEQNKFVGGKFRATEWGKTKAFHEHSYHMFLNWYHNFFEIADEIGVRDKFTALERVRFLRAGSFPKMTELVNFGAPSAIPQNLLSGVLSIPDMFLYMYSVVDLLGTQMGQDRYQDLISVNAFASSKLYATEASVGMYDEYLAKTFAIASYLTSAKTFQTFLEYGANCPSPLYWALTGDSFNAFLHPLELELRRRGVKIWFNHQVTELILVDGKVSKIGFQRSGGFDPSLNEMPLDQYRKDFSPPEEAFGEDDPKNPEDVGDALILALPHKGLSDLLNPLVLNRSPQLGECDKLISVPMASVHLHLNKKFSRRLASIPTRLPPEPVVLLDSRFKLSFVSNSSLWPGSRETYINIVASDSRPLGHLEAPAAFTSDADWIPAGDPPKLSIQAPVTTLDYILNEFRRFVPFEDDEIELDLLQLDRNTGRELFINDVGSWKWRPDTHTQIENLFLAGDYCRNSIDVVCLEGAVVSGLQAAELVRRRCGIGSPIKIVVPKRRPNAAYWPLKIVLTPYAVGAKAWSFCNELMGNNIRQT
jgi:flavin-dependent amine oxidoreductase/putative NAD(P)-binding protein